jgi:hypothetical protein
MAAPEGNEYSSVNNRLWANTLRRAIVQGDGERLRRIAERLLDKAEEGDLPAIRELGDRLDGKAAQAIVGADGGPVQFQEIVRKIVDPKNEGL